MSLSGFAVKYKPIVISAVLIAMVYGGASFFTMPRREDPEFTVRVCVISTRWPGAPAIKVEELVTDKIEEEVNSIEEVDFVRSTSTLGLSTVFVTLNDRVNPKDIQNVWDKVRSRVELAEMPDPSLRPIVNDEFGDTSILVLAIYQVPIHGREEIRDDDRYSFRELEVVADEIKDALRLVPGVGKVDKFGVREEAVYIESEMGNWAQIDLTMQSLQRLADERNIIEPGGQIPTPEGQFSINPGGEFNTVNEIEQIASVVRSGEEENSVYLSELGLSVTRDYEDPARYICRFGNTETSTPAITLGVTMKAGSNIIDICERCKARVTELVEVEQRLPADIAVTPVSDQSENVSAKISDVVVNMVQAIIIVVAVVFLVIGFRTSFVMAANIPIVVVAAIGIVTFFNVQLEQISLAALIISLGLLVDNAVQVCDQARTNQLAGMKPMQAAIEGANTLAIPMLVGTATTMAAFLPMLVALQGGAAEYVYSLPVTVSTTLAISWILAMTFCVILAGIIIRVPARDPNHKSLVVRILEQLSALAKRKSDKNQEDSDDTTTRETSKEKDGSNSSNPIFAAYRSLALPAIQFKWLTIAAVVAVVAVILSLPVSSEFFPDADRDQLAVEIQLPETATIEQTDAIAKQVEDIIRKLSPVRNNETTYNDHKHRLRAMRTLVGGGGSRWHLGWDPEPQTRSYAEILIRTTDGRFTSEFAHRLRMVCERGDESLGIQPVVGAKVVPVKLALGPPADPLLLRVIGNGFADRNTLRGISQKLESIVTNQPETWNVKNSWGVDGYQINVDVKEDLATLAGVTNSQVARTLNSYYTGLKLTDFREGDHVVPVYFRLRPDERNSIQGLRQSFVEGDKGKVPLTAVADFQFSWQPAKIQRRDMNRVIEVSSRMEPGVTGNDVVERVLDSKEFKELEQSLPAGFWIEPGGSYEESQDASAQMGLSFLMSFMLILFCLIIQYNGWAKPIVILATLPLGLAGAWLGLFLTDNALGFMPQLGILALFGIVLNTAIIFVEFADLLVAEKNKQLGENANGPISGLTRQQFRECLVRAGQQRMLPIFLTTATTVGGLIPLALTGGPLWTGLAWCMMVGLIFTTLLTLFVVPAVYAILVETLRIKPIPDADES